MQTLIIILIVTMIIQTVIFTYSNFVDEKRNKQMTSFQEQMKNAQADYIEEKRKFEKIIENKDGFINYYAAELRKMQQMRDKSGMVKFNLNKEILVEITDKGWERLTEKNIEQYIDHCIKPNEVKIDGKSYYKLQAHQLGELFEPADWVTAIGPVKPVVMLYWSDLEEAKED